MSKTRRRVLLVQLPIPPLGPQSIRGNVPLAAGYMKMFARRRGLEVFFDIDLLPTYETNTYGDQSLVEAILCRDPWLVGFTCYLWNIDRTLWLVKRLKELRHDLRIVLGGPEITTDNAWVLEQPTVDYAVIGEGEQTFADLLLALIHEDSPPIPIDGLLNCGSRIADGGWEHRNSPSNIFRPRKPLPTLDLISSPYLEGILDAADERMLLLETIRGCVFKCKFCYYPKSYDALYFLSEDKLMANLKHAQERGAREVVLLDPTLNQRKDFADFLRLLARCNPEQQFTYFGELRSEGINTETARLLRQANFTEVEIGLQSTDPHAQELMDRKNNLRAFERGARAMLDQGTKVKVDLIVGLPGDTVDSIRKSMHYLRDSGLYTDVQVFNLAILPGTSFRHEANQLGLAFQPRPPYYVLNTPTLRREDLFQLMQEAQEVFGMDWDPLPPPRLPSGEGAMVSGDLDLVQCRHFDLDHPTTHHAPARTPYQPQAQAFTLWLHARNFAHQSQQAAALITQILKDNPFTTLQVVLEPAANPGASRCGDPRTPAHLASLTRQTLQTLMIACQRQPTYLDRFYALQPGRPIGAKRLIVVLPLGDRDQLDPERITEIGEYASLVWRGETGATADWEEHEYLADSELGTENAERSFVPSSEFRPPR